jgi:hypothetical protein
VRKVPQAALELCCRAGFAGRESCLVEDTRLASVRSVSLQREQQQCLRLSQATAQVGIEFMPMQNWVRLTLESCIVLRALLHFMWIVPSLLLCKTTHVSQNLKACNVDKILLLCISLAALYDSRSEAATFRITASDRVFANETC